MYNVIVSKTEEEDLKTAASYISNALKNETAAKNLIKAFNKTAMSLSEMPERFPIINDDILKKDNIRFTRINNYLLFYTVHHYNNSVFVLRFLYGRRNWESILKI